MIIIGPVRGAAVEIAIGPAGFGPPRRVFISPAAPSPAGMLMLYLDVEIQRLNEVKTLAHF